MWFLRRMLRVSWTEKRTNLEILNTASSTRKLMSNIKRRPAEFLGHVMRKGKLEHLLTTGKIEGKRSRGHQRIKIQDSISSLAGKKHCGDVCGCKRSQKVEGHDRLRLQQTQQLMMMMMILCLWVTLQSSCCTSIITSWHQLLIYQICSIQCENRNYLCSKQLRLRMLESAIERNEQA